ncbi:hypothetical protein BDM02DRAFT_3189941 [Thelephora ganbajun]|uniref:Uncharacterized protein n=1 Tax=Thelephora ganbajun TaxID=370292 RepID=A0ACB6Z719_THEGA|nr:hypothetical protein BDM02DRAFT_3189941 [Thelephora ganbajun]
MALNLKHDVPAIAVPADGGERLSKLSGTIDYTPLVVHQSKHRSLLQSSAFELIGQKALNGLFVVEAKLDGKQFADHVPQAIAAMHAIATFLG